MCSSGVAGGGGTCGVGFSSALCGVRTAAAGFSITGCSGFGGTGGAPTGGVASCFCLAAINSATFSTAVEAGVTLGETTGVTAGFCATGAAGAGAFTACGGTAWLGDGASTPSTCRFNSIRSRRRPSVTSMLSSVSLRSCCRSLCCRQRRKTVASGVAIATASSASTTGTASTFGTLPYVRDP